MKHLALYLLLLYSSFGMAQTGAYIQVKDDSVKVRQAELVIENSSKNVNGFLFNKASGKTEFRKLELVNLSDTAIAIAGQDTILFRGGGPGAVSVIPEVFLSVRAIDAANQQLKWWKTPQDLYTSPRVGVLGGSQGKGAFTSTYSNSVIGRLTTYLNQVCTNPVVTNYCENGYNTRRISPTGANQYVDVSRNITKALADGNKIIILVTPSNDADPNGAGGATPIEETLANIALIEDACIRAGATLFVFSGFPRHEFTLEAQKQQEEVSYLLLKKFGARCAFVYKLLEDPNVRYHLNPALQVGDNMHLNDQGALIAYQPMRDVLVNYYSANTLISKYVIQKAANLNAGFADVATVTTQNTNTYNLPFDQSLYRVRFYQYDGYYSPWSNIAQGIGSSSSQFPTVNAGANQSVNLPATLTLTATANDPDGSIVTYLWTKESGGSAIIASPGTAQTTVSNLEAGTYVFRCTVTDNSGLQASDDVQVTVTSPAIAKTARFNFSLSSKPVSGFTNLFGNPHTGLISGTDASSNISINTIAAGAWTGNGTVSAIDNLAVVNDGGGFTVPQEVLQNAFFSGASSAVDNLQITGLTPGASCKILVIGNAVSTPRVTNVRVNGQDRQYNATGNSSKAAIFDFVEVPGDGKINIAMYANSGSPFGIVSAVVVSEYQGAGTGNQLPTVNAGSDQTVTLPGTPSISATASDPDGAISTYTWTKVSGGPAIINTPNAASSTLSGLTTGVYVFRCTVTDNDGGTAYDDVQITINGPSIARTAKFNFSLTSKPVSGFVNLFGNPHQAVLSGSQSGIGINTISTASYTPNGTVSAVDNLTVSDDGGGYIVPQDALRNCIFTGNNTGIDNLQITGLTPGKYCKVMLTASAVSTPRLNNVKINGVVQQFNAVGNTSKAAIFDFILVPADGKINIAFYPASGSPFGLAAAVVVDEYNN